MLTWRIKLFQKLVGILHSRTKDLGIEVFSLKLLSQKAMVKELPTIRDFDGVCEGSQLR